MPDPTIEKSGQTFGNSIALLLLDTPAKESLLKMTDAEVKVFVLKLAAVLGEHPALALLKEATTVKTIVQQQEIICELQDWKIMKLESEVQTNNILLGETIAVQQALEAKKKELEREQQHRAQ
ncbi:hypothetical protein LTR97_009178 [Elasticomyces elasticus]|uniref:Uncharacterized protein n=1 Tax=Elasticomyces elasticus TaxID=574655 RepID=A0AAN7VW61_9PEZI|nr:hypothetical protein LTR97_009178 [Elasticomyces elasticus]KAK5728331.1 hypothetical protein LTR15_001466 [Elasticomyces elasticus]